MPGRRPFSPAEETRLLHVTRTLDSRARLLVTTGWLTGLRLSEILRLTVSSVVRHGEPSAMLGVAPRLMKGGRGPTRWIPIVPALREAVALHLAHLGRHHALRPDLPLFISRKGGPDGSCRPLGRESARRILASVFAAAGIADDGRLGSHSLRKTWSKHVYANAGNDIMTLKAALGHRDVATTQRYLEPDADKVLAAMLACDFTCRPRLERFLPLGDYTAIHPLLRSQTG